MTPEELARAVAADIGPETAAELEQEIAGVPPPGGGTRSFGVSEAMSVAGFLFSAAGVALEVWRARRDSAELVADIANGLQIDPRLAARLDPEKRLSLTAQILNHMLPDQFGRHAPERAEPRQPLLAERQRWITEYVEQRRRETNVTTRSWNDVATRDFIGGATILVPFAEQDHWIVFNTIGWIPDASDGLDVVRVDVPKGFVTDLASVPSYLWTILNRTGRYGNAAIYHDWLYWQQNELPGVTRAVADKVFDRAMHDMGVDAVTRNLIWAGVRVFGGSYWDDNTRAKAAGEKRVLKRFPESPTITWAEWRQRADVFA